MQNKMTTIRVAAILFLGIFSGCEEEIILDPSLDVDTYAKRFMEKYDVPGLAFCLIRDGEVSSQHYFGLADKKSKRVVDNRSVFSFASLSKPVTATAVLIAHSEGVLSLDDDINDYLPEELRNPWYPDSQITFRQLLNHTSSLVSPPDIVLQDIGIPSMPPEGGDSSVSLAELFATLSQQSEAFKTQFLFRERPPGSRMEYSNLGYALAGYGLELASGVTFAQYCQDHLFDPLGLQSFTWYVEDTDKERLVTPYEAGKELKPYGMPELPAGGLRGTVYDYARFMTLYLKPAGGLIPEDLMHEAMTSEYIADGWGLGWSFTDFNLDPYNGENGWHNGAMPGGASIAVFNPNSGNGYVAATNQLTPQGGMAMEFLSGMQFELGAKLAQEVNLY